MQKRKLMISKRTILHITVKNAPAYWIKTTGAATCPLTSTAPHCSKLI